LPWSKGWAVAAALDGGDEPIIVIADADVLVPPDALSASITAVADGAPWAMPHGLVYRLSRAATNEVYVGALVPPPHEIGGMLLERDAVPGPPGGGIVVTTRHAYAESGGIDPRFYGWGGEDISFARALDTLVGPGVRSDAPMWHLYHLRQARRPGNRAALADSERLANRYLDAAGDPDAMRRLIRT
jgi:hypothetical protein